MQKFELLKLLKKSLQLEWTEKVNQQNDSLLTSPKYDVLSLCKILVKNINNQRAFEVSIRSKVIANYLIILNEFIFSKDPFCKHLSSFQKSYQIIKKLPEL